MINEATDLRQLLGAIDSRQSDGLQLRYGVVTADNPLAVRLGAATTAVVCYCLDSYHPLVGDLVAVLVNGADRLVLGSPTNTWVKGIVAATHWTGDVGGPTSVTTNGQAITSGMTYTPRNGRWYRLAANIRALVRPTYVDTTQYGGRCYVSPAGGGGETLTGLNADRWLWTATGYNYIQVHLDWLFLGDGNSHTWTLRMDNLRIGGTSLDFYLPQYYLEAL